jgi:hypothetical protein
MSAKKVKTSQSTISQFLVQNKNITNRASSKRSLLKSDDLPGQQKQRSCASGNKQDNVQSVLQMYKTAEVQKEPTANVIINLTPKFEITGAPMPVAFEKLAKLFNALELTLDYLISRIIDLILGN